MTSPRSRAQAAGYDPRSPSTVSCRLAKATAFDEIGSGVSGLVFQSTTPRIVTVAADEAFVRESGQARFTIRRSGNLSQGITVRYVVRGTARSGVDFEPFTGLVFLGAGQVREDLVLRPIPDAEFEGPESVVLSLTNTHETNYIIGPDHHASITIDDRPRRGSPREAPEPVGSRVPR